ncbi:18955_t:CDS:2, partial [Racocetra persica]
FIMPRKGSKTATKKAIEKKSTKRDRTQNQFEGIALRSKRLNHATKTVSSQETLSTDPENSRTLSEDSIISILSDQTNSEIGGALSEVNKSYSQQNSEISIKAVNSKPNSEASNQQQTHHITDPISYSQTYDIDIESSSHLHEEQFTGLTNTFLTTTNRPSTS